MKFHEYVDRYLNTYVAVRSKRMGAPTKIQSLRKHILPFLGDYEIADIDTMLADDFLAHLAKKPSERIKGKTLSNKTINNISGILKHILKRAHRQKLIKEIPYVDNQSTTRKEPRRLVMAEIEALLLADIPARTKQMLMLLVFTGMRIGEVRALNWRNVHLDENYIYVCESSPSHSLEIFDTTKTGKDFKAPIAPALKEVLKTFHRPFGLVFEDLGSPGVPLRYDVCNKAITAACAVAGIKRFTAHAFRHTNISMHVADAKNGAGLVRFFVGHSDIRTTQRYIDRDQTLDRGAMDSFEALFPADIFLKLKNSIKTGT